MLSDTLDKIIMEAMKNHDDVRKETFREIKKYFTEWKTSEKNAGKKFDEAAEQEVLVKLFFTYKGAIKDFAKQKREDLVASYEPQLAIIRTLVPPEPSEAEIRETLNHIFDEGQIEKSKKNMSKFIDRMKEIHPTVDGALAAQIIARSL